MSSGSNSSFGSSSNQRPGPAAGPAPGTRAGGGAGVGPGAGPGSGAATETGVRPATPAAPGMAVRPPYGPASAALPGMQAIRQPVYGQGMIVSLLVAAALVVLAILASGDADDSRLPIAQTTTPAFWGLAVLAILVAGVGAQRAEATAARAAAGVGRPRPTTAMATAWTVPVVATLAAILLVATYHNRIMLVAGPLIAFLGNAGALLSRDLLDDAGDSAHRTATAIHTLVIHAVAFLALGAVYLNKLSPWVGAPLVGIIAGLLTLETLERGTADKPRRLLYALLGGAAVAEALIALNWWQTHGWTGGAVLLVCFYLAAGVLLAATQRSILRTRDLVEFGLVGLLAFVVLAATA